MTKQETRTGNISFKCTENAFADVPLGARVWGYAIPGMRIQGSVVGISELRREFAIVQWDGPTLGGASLVTNREALELAEV